MVRVVRMCESKIIFQCVNPSMRSVSVHLFVTLSPPKSHRAEFNQTCYINFPHCQGVREQQYFFRPCVRPSVFRPSVRHAPPKKREEKSPGSATITNRSPSQTPRGQLGINKNHAEPLGNSTKFATSFPLMVRVCEGNIIFFRASVVRLPVRHAIAS